MLKHPPFQRTVKVLELSSLPWDNNKNSFRHKGFIILPRFLGGSGEGGSWGRVNFLLVSSQFLWVIVLLTEEKYSFLYLLLFFTLYGENYHNVLAMSLQNKLPLFRSLTVSFRCFLFSYNKNDWFVIDFCAVLISVSDTWFTAMPLCHYWGNTLLRLTSGRRDWSFLKKSAKTHREPKAKHDELDCEYSWNPLRVKDRV